MKKFFSLLCAILLVVSASAAPVAQKAQLVKKAPVAVEQMQKVQLEKAQTATLQSDGIQLEPMQTANKNQVSAAPAVKVINQKAAIARQPKVVKANLDKATVKPAARKLATGEPIVVIIKGNPQIVSKSGKTTIEATGNDDIIYGWIISTESLEEGKTYTYADMGEHNVYRYDNSFTVYEEATDGTFSIDAEKNITASMVTESGTYLVYTNDPTPPQPSYEIVDVTAVSCNWADYETDMMYTLSDANGDIYQFDIYYTGSFELGHTYTYADMDKSYSCYATGGNGYAFETAEFTLTENEKGLKHIVATITVPAFNKQFNITYDQPEPQSKTIVASDFSMTDYGTDMFFILTDSDGNQFRFDVLYTGSFEFDKTYTLADMDPDYSWYKLATGGGLTYTEASFTITKDKDELLHVVAAAVLNNGDSYEITYDEKAWTPTGVKIDVNATNYKAEYFSSYGEYNYTASNTDFNIALWVYTDTELGTFDEDVDIEGSYLQEAGGGDYVIFHSVATPIVVAQDEDGNKSLTGSLYDKNGDEYVFNLTYEKPAVEEISVLVEDATMTKKTLFFQVDGDDTENAYGITVRVNSKVLEGEFTLDNCEPYNTGVTDLSTKKWFETDSCYIQTQMLGSNTLLMQGILYTHNTSLGRFINAEFVLTARVDANGELMDIYGGIVEPAKGDTISLTRSEKGTAFFKNPSTGGLAFGDQSGKTTMVAVNDSAYYWYNPISKLTTGYWIKGIKDKAANTINFDTAQVINVYNGGTLLGLMKWMKVTTAGSISIATDGAEQFILDINEDTLTLHGSAPFDFTQDVLFPGVVVPGYGFQGYGDAGTILYIPGWTPSTELITPPAGLVTVKMPFTGSGAAEEYADSVLVGWDNDTVYIQGLAVDFPTAWIKGVFKEGVVTFEKFQFVGMYGGSMPIWVLGTNAESELLDFTMTYDAQANLFKATNIFVVNASYEKIYYLDKVSKIVIGEVAQADWGEWEDFAPFGYNTGSWTFVAMATSPTTYNNYVALVRTDKNNADNKQIKITNWGEGWFGEGVELIINWNAKDNTCSIDKQFTGYVHTTYGNVYVASVEDGTYNPETGTFSINVDYFVSAGSFGNGVETYVMDTKQPGLPYDTDAPFDATFAWRDMDASITDGVIGIYATNAENYTIGLELYADPAATEIPEGVYTISDSQEAGTALQSLGVYGGFLTECWAGIRTTSGISDCWFIVEGTITLSYDEYGKLKVVVDGKNSYGQPVTALVQYVKLEPKSTVDIVSTNLSYADEWYAQYGIQEFVLTNDNYGVLLDIFADTLVGEFTEEDVDLADSYIVDFNTGVKIPVVNTGNIVVTLDGKNLALTATLIGADTIQYNISATGYLGYIQGDAIDAYEGEFAVKNVTFAQYSKSQIALSASNEVGDTVTIVVKGELKNAVLPAGEYSRVMASIGFTAEYDVYPSFVGNNAGVWFIQSGKLTVAEDGSMLFEGLNSYDKDVTIKFIASPTDLININAAVKATKVVRNGRMMVIKDAKVYSVLGQQIQ